MTGTCVSPANLSLPTSHNVIPGYVSALAMNDSTNQQTAMKIAMLLKIILPGTRKHVVRT